MALGLVLTLPTAAGAASGARQEEPVLAVTKFHPGQPFFHRGANAEYVISVSNTGTAATTGTVTVKEIPPAGITVTGFFAPDWDCSVATLTCTISEALAPGNSYRDIRVRVTVAADAPATVVNKAEVSGGGSAPASAEDRADVLTTVPPTASQLSIGKSHSGAFPQGGTGTYTLTVSNAAGAGPTSGEVTVTDSLPTGVTPASVSGTGWTCSMPSGAVTCGRSDPLAAGESYAPITLTVNVSAGAACTFTNSATVSGGGSSSYTTTDSTDVSGGTCGGGGGGNGGGSPIVFINLGGIFSMFSNFSFNQNVNSPGATNATNQELGANAP
ncbi:hypothetical protein [Streptomyces sp. NPDC096339]|uniref:hypothetical protein n=1 Tax=Streptomyces sp. NPDC096339 TaxID=3366086 RepID=UPI00382FE0DC